MASKESKSVLLMVYDTIYFLICTKKRDKLYTPMAYQYLYRKPFCIFYVFRNVFESDINVNLIEMNIKLQDRVIQISPLKSNDSFDRFLLIIFLLLFRIGACTSVSGTNLEAATGERVDEGSAARFGGCVCW